MINKFKTFKNNSQNRRFIDLDAFLMLIYKFKKKGGINKKKENNTIYISHGYRLN